MADKIFDTVIIGAGPAGSVAAANLLKLGHSVAVVEKSHFPRFSIGESLLPQCVVDLENADLYDVVKKRGFQDKDGANFWYLEQESSFDFSEKFSNGPYMTFQVQRSEFDKVLIDECEKRGAHVSYGQTVTGINFEQEGLVRLKTQSAEGNDVVCGRFVLDASGFGRVLPRLLDLDIPTSFPPRQAIFCHIKDNFSESFERKKILVAIHDKNPDIWFWVISFSDGTSSLGVVGDQSIFDELQGSNEDKLWALIREVPRLNQLLESAELAGEVRAIKGYASKVKSMYGDQFALLGNAGEFLDPVFSSGVTIAMRSATLASELVHKQLQGENVDWQTDFSEELSRGVEAFKAFVMSWYDQDLQKIILAENPNPKIKSLICSVLAGYAWDEENPYNKKSSRRIKALAQAITEL